MSVASRSAVAVLGAMLAMPAFAEEPSAAAADMRMRWEPVLDGEFYRLSMENRMTGQDGQSWHFKGDAMRIDWGTPDIERGRSTYRLTADALEVTDEVYTKDLTLAVFGRTRLTRR